MIVIIIGLSNRPCAGVTFMYVRVRVRVRSRDIFLIFLVDTIVGLGLGLGLEFVNKFGRLKAPISEAPSDRH